MRKLIEMDFSVRALNSFKNLGFNYLEDFKHLTDYKMRELGMSAKTVQEVVSILKLEKQTNLNAMNLREQLCENFALNFHNWMRENDTQENAEQWFGFSDQDMLNAFKNEKK